MSNLIERADPRQAGKEKSNAKNFRIPISNGIFEHYERLKDSRWLLDLYVDWTTKEVRMPDGSLDGVVLGGKPLRDEDAAVPFGCCPRTTRRWRLRLARFGYISQKRTPVGYVIRVKKSKKWPERPDKNVRSDRTKMSDHSERELQDVSDQNYRSCPIRITDHVRSNKTLQGLYKDKAVGEEAAAASHPLFWKEILVDPRNLPNGILKLCEDLHTKRGNQSAIEFLSACMDAIQGMGWNIPKQIAQAKAELRANGNRNQLREPMRELEAEPWGAGVGAKQ